jgi:hypothetical protein
VGPENSSEMKSFCGQSYEWHTWPRNICGVEAVWSEDVYRLVGIKIACSQSLGKRKYERLKTHGKTDWNKNAKYKSLFTYQCSNALLRRQ